METFERKAIRVWMRQVMETKGWSATRWANEAGTSPTNITRFLSGAKHTPSSSTISRLSLVAGSAPDLSRNQFISPLVNTVIVHDNQEEKIGVISVFGLSGELKAYRLGLNVPDARISEDDIIVVRLQKEYKEGDLILICNHGDFFVGRQTERKSSLYCLSGHRFWKSDQVETIGRIVQIINHLDDTAMI